MPSPDSPTSETDTSIAATSIKHELSTVNRPAPRTYGKGRYGVSKYDDRDDTRHAWARVLPPIAAIVLSFLFSAPAVAATNSYCETADASTPIYGFCKPSVDTEGATAWGTKNNENWLMAETAINAINTSTTSQLANITALIASTVSLNALKLAKAGDTMTGQLTNTSSVTVHGDMRVNGAFTFAGGFTGLGGNGAVQFATGTITTGDRGRLNFNNESGTLAIGNGISTPSARGFYITTGASSGYAINITNSGGAISSFDSGVLGGLPYTSFNNTGGPMYFKQNSTTFGGWGASGGFAVGRDVYVTDQAFGTAFVATSFQTPIVYFGDTSTVSSTTVTGGIQLSGSFSLRQRTRAQIDLLAPTSSRPEYIECTDCTLPGICRSTGTLAAQWRKLESATLGCGTNN